MFYWNTLQKILLEWNGQFGYPIPFVSNVQEQKRFPTCLTQHQILWSCWISAFLTNFFQFENFQTEFVRGRDCHRRPRQVDSRSQGNGEGFNEINILVLETWDVPPKMF